MAVTPFQLVDNQTFLPVDIVNGKIYESPNQFNGIGVDLSTGIRLTIDYHDLQSIPFGAKVQATLESKSMSGQYSILAYQFEEFRRTGVPERAQIIMFPDLNWADAAVDNIIFVGGSTVERVSNTPGLLPGTWRVSIHINDPNNSFISVRLSIYGERFNNSAFPTDYKGLVSDSKTGSVLTIKHRG